MRFKMVSLIYMLLVLSTESVFSEDLTKLLPKVDGWQESSEPAFYSRDNLFEYINGNCELYFSYGFEGLINAYFSKTSNLEHEITVDIYDMGAPLNAFGVYSSMTHPDYTYTSIGEEAIVSPQQIRFWQDRYEIEIRSNFTEDSEEVLKTFAAQISHNIPASSPLKLFNWLPESNRIPHTVKYIAKGFLGQDFLPGGAEALYNVDGDELTGFVVNCGDSDQAIQFLKQFKINQSALGGVELKSFADHFESYHKYSGYMWVGQYDNWLYGAVSESDSDTVRKLANDILQNLKNL